MANPDKNVETRGIPPARPLPSQIMHLLELTHLEIGDAAAALNTNPDLVERWMAFKSKDPMPVGSWLLLNMFTLAVKGKCWSDAMWDFVIDRFPNAFVKGVKPRRSVVFPEKRLAVPKPNGIAHIIAKSGCSPAECAEFLYVSEGKMKGWIDETASGAPMPYSLYELLIMTLWAEGKYTPTPDAVRYIEEKYNGAFKP